MAGFGTEAHAFEAHWLRGGPAVRPKMPPRVPTFDEVARSSSNLPRFRATVHYILRTDSRARDWLVAWFRRETTMDLCHDGAECPATTYFHALLYSAVLCAWIAAERGDAELTVLAREHIERTLCLTAILTSPRWTYVGPAMRGKQPAPRVGGQDLASILGQPIPGRWSPGGWYARHASRAARLARERGHDHWIFCRQEVVDACLTWVERREHRAILSEVLSTIICGCAPIVVRHYTGGHEAFYVSAPRGYDNPQPGGASYVGGDEVACVRQDLVDAGRFPPKAEELKPGVPVLIEDTPEGMVYSIPPQPGVGGWKEEGYRRVIAHPPGELMRTFRIRGRLDAVQEPRPEPVVPSSGLTGEAAALLADLQRLVEQGWGGDALRQRIRTDLVDYPGASELRRAMGLAALAVLR